MSDEQQPPTEITQELPALELLLPGELPVSVTLDPAQHQQADRALQAFRRALASEEHNDSLQQLEDLLQTLEEIPTSAAHIDKTWTPLSSDEVKDYDHYFALSRVNSSQPFLSLIKGLVLSTTAFMQLVVRMDKLPLHRVEQQLKGFHTYAELLARTAGIQALTNEPAR